jgi:hypothetical protein
MNGMKSLRENSSLVSGLVRLQTVEIPQDIVLRDLSRPFGTVQSLPRVTQDFVLG